MRILISGSSGFIGKALTTYLEQQGHQVFRLTRKKDNRLNTYYWQPETGEIHLDTKNEETNIDAVINLCGVNIGDRLWSEKRKQSIINSRTQSTALLAKTFIHLPNPPKVFINASAIGFYGNSDQETFNEKSPAGTNFLAQVVTQWEAAAQPITQSDIRTVFIRSGVVLGKQSGMLKKMLTPFRLGLGGKVGTGRQYLSWISLLDEIRAIEFILQKAEINGPINLCSPNPVRNLEFTRALGNVLNRPTLLPLPTIVVKTLFAEMGQLLLLEGCRVFPTKLQQAGFHFQHATLEDALKYAIKENP